jgi:hypothetical protein
MSAPAVFKRLAAVLGLLLMAPIGLQLVTGTLTPADAAVRAAGVFVFVVVSRLLLGRVPTAPRVVVAAPTPAPAEETSRPA